MRRLSSSSSSSRTCSCLRTGQCHRLRAPPAGTMASAAHLAAAPDTQPTSSVLRKPISDPRDYRAITLDNGLRFVLVHDPEVVFAATAVNVQVGYMHDPPEVPGLAHFLEHAVHLGSALHPDEGEYKAFLAKHGGASNASTGMVHTVAHLTVHHGALDGALSRLGQFFVAPLLLEEAAAREVSNVHSEFSRNCNSDARKVLQLHRSVCRGPYSQFSTGNITTLRDTPAEQGIHVASLLRQFWIRHYTADRTCGCVVAPQPLDQVEAWVRQAFAGVRPHLGAPLPSHLAERYDALGTPLQRGGSELAPLASALASNGNGNGHGTDFGDAGKGGKVAARMLQGMDAEVAAPGQAVACVLRVSPQREALRSLELSWLIPHGAMGSNDVKPWRWVGHLLGHEGPGSLAAALKAQGLITALEAGVGDEMRLEPGGFMWWGVTLQLTEAGLARVPHLVLAVHHALGLVRALPDARRRAVYQEAAQVAELRFEFADRAEPRDLAKDLAWRAHYWPHEQLLSGPSLLERYDGAVVDAFLSRLVPSRLQVTVCAKDAAGAQPRRERWYGAVYSHDPLPQDLVDACASALHNHPTPGAAPHANSGGAAPTPPLTIAWAAGALDAPAAGAAAGELATHKQPGGGVSVVTLPALAPPGPNWALPVDTALVADQSASKGKELPPPTLVVDAPGCRMWHSTDTTWDIPKVHAHLHLASPLVYGSPAAWVRARLLVRLLDDLLQRDVYDAELLGTSFSLSASETGLNLHLKGFSSVVPPLLRHVLGGLRRLATDVDHVRSRHPIFAAKLAQQLQLWRHNNPLQHAEYATDHLLQETHWHVNDSLEALFGAGRVPDEAVPAPAAADAADGERQQQRYAPEVSPEEVSALAAQLLSGRDVAVEGLCHGNVDEAGARALAGVVRDALRPQGAPQGGALPQVTVLRVQRLRGDGAAAAESGGNGDGDAGGAAGAPKRQRTGAEEQEEVEEEGVLLRYVVDNPNPSNGNSAIVYLCQVCDEREAGGVQQGVLLSLLTSMASKPAFYELRTRQQLGYVVSLSQHRQHGVLGLQVRIQSPHGRPSKLRRAVQAWLAEFRTQLASMPAQQVSEFVASLSSRLAEPPRSLSEAASRPWSHIASRTYAFTRRQEKLAALRALADGPGGVLPHLVRFFDRHVLPAVGAAPGAAEPQDGGGGGGNGVASADGGGGVVGGGRSRVLVCEVWGGAAGPTAEEEREEEGAALGVAAKVGDAELAAFKARLGKHAPWPAWAPAPPVNDASSRL